MPASQTGLSGLPHPSVTALTESQAEVVGGGSGGRLVLTSG